MPNLLAILLALQASSPAAELPDAPQFDLKEATPSVLVATSRPGDSYATPAECNAKIAICLRYPLWFTATPILSIYGKPLQRDFIVTTYTHYGQPDEDSADSPQLMLIFSAEGHHLMPVYASERLWRRSDGTYFMLVDNPYPHHWPPCSVKDLWEPISIGDFSRDARVPKDAFAVREYPELFTVTRDQAFPKQGISVERLRAHLSKIQPDIKDFNCEVVES